MPPKGWRKNGESSQIPKEAELVSIDDILFPRSTIQKLAKQIISIPQPSAISNASDNMSLTKDSLIAVQRSATVFVSHLMFHARSVARESGRKNVNSQDVLQALARADLSGFVPEIQQKLSTFEYEADAKKKSKTDIKDIETVDDEPAKKKLKDDSHKSVSKSGDNETEDGLDEEDDAVTIDEDNEGTVNDDATETDMEEAEEERVAINPISILGKEEQELGGSEPKDIVDGNETEDE